MSDTRPDKFDSCCKRMACNLTCKIGIAVIILLAVVGSTTYVVIAYTNKGIKLLLSNYFFSVI